jgi:nitrate reductase beta subunit
MLFQEAKRLTHDFAGKVVMAILDLRLHKLLKLRVSETFMLGLQRTCENCAVPKGTR